MKKIEALRETMDMPNPQFPIKVHYLKFDSGVKQLFPPHWHEHIEMLYFVKGAAMIECGAKQIHAEVGDLVVINSNELHYGVNRSEQVIYYALIADLSLVQSQFLDAAGSKFIKPLSQNRLLLHNHIKDDSHATQCVINLIQEISEQKFGYELAVKAELFKLLTILVRNYYATELSQVEYAQRMKNIERFDPIFQHIEQHFAEELSVDQLAKLAGLSRFHFSRLFKELCGRTIIEYITAFRLDKAEHFLQHSNLPISEIAAKCGFNDMYYFSRTFKKHFGYPPSAVRQANKLI